MLQFLARLGHHEIPVCAGRETPLPLTVNIAPGPQQGQTALTGGTPNVWVCLEPDVEGMKAKALEVFGR